MRVKVRGSFGEGSFLQVFCEFGCPKTRVLLMRIEKIENERKMESMQAKWSQNGTSET